MAGSGDGGFELDPICDSHAGVTCERSVDGAVKALRPDRRTSVFVQDFVEFKLELKLPRQGVT